MGTTWRLNAVIEDDRCERDLDHIVRQAADLVISQMSQWDRASELSRFNASPPASRHRISPQFSLVLDCALTIADATDGAFDPALGFHSSLWGIWSGPILRAARS